MLALAMPWVFGVAAAGALGVVGLHLLSVRRPPELLLPTARFLPDRDVRTVARARRPSDLLLLALRIALLLLAGLAASGPSWRARAQATLQLAIVGDGIQFDTTAVRTLLTTSASTGIADDGEHALLSVIDAPGAEAAVFPTAMRWVTAHARTGRRIDSVELHVLTRRVPTDDAAWTAWRATWPGRVILHTRPESASRVSVRATRRFVLQGDVARGGDDVVQAALRWHAAQRAVPPDTPIDTVRLERDSPVDGGARGNGAGGILIRWPRDGVPRGWNATPARSDSAMALATQGQALMGPWPIPAVPRDTLARPLIWWSTGDVAATERQTPAGCVREVAIVPPRAGDALLSPAARGLFEVLLAPCADSTRTAVNALVGTHRDSLVPTAASTAAMVRDAAPTSTPWLIPALYLASMILLGAEWLVRVRTRGALA